MKNIANRMMDSDCKPNKVKTPFGKSKRKDAKVRRELARKWGKMLHMIGYQKAAVKESCKRLTSQLEEELFDGILLNLQSKSCARSFGIQKRIVRRIVEKRQAQLVHCKVGRTSDGFARHMSQRCASRSMEDLVIYRRCL